MIGALHVAVHYSKAQARYSYKSPQPCLSYKLQGQQNSVKKLDPPLQPLYDMPSMQSSHHPHRLILQLSTPSWHLGSLEEIMPHQTGSQDETVSFLQVVVTCGHIQVQQLCLWAEGTVV